MIRTIKRKVPKKKKRRSSDHLEVMKNRAQTIFNKYIRLRDQGRPCISCGKFTGSEAGHYLTVKKHPHVRFHELNVSLQCSHCNRILHGNEAHYRKGLVERYGESTVKKFEEENLKWVVYKWTREELQNIIDTYTDKINSL